MSRIDDGWEPEDTADFLRACAFGANMERAVAGKKGQKFLRELEAALLALPEKKLCYGSLADFKIEYPLQALGDPIPERGKHIATGEVCALGAVALAREMAKGRDRAAVLQELADDEDPDETCWEKTENAAHYLGICHPLAFKIIEMNDEFGGRSDEERYERMLAWVRRNIKTVEKR